MLRLKMFVHQPLSLFLISDLSWIQVLGSGTGSLVAIVADNSFYILRFDRDAYSATLEEGVEITDKGVEETFKVVTEISGR
jgi:coatomer subunit beta'